MAAINNSRSPNTSRAASGAAGAQAVAQQQPTQSTPVAPATANNPANSIGGTLQGGSGGGVNRSIIGEDYSVYTPDVVRNNEYNAQQRAIRDNSAAIAGRPIMTMDAANSAGATIDQQQQAQFRNQQLALGNALMSQANGEGPSVAGSQLRQSTEMNLQAALAQAASTRGGNLGAAQYQLGNARANIQQQAAQQLAQTRIQEQMAARSQLGDVLNAGRGADIGLALNQAQLGQQNNQFNAGLQQQTNSVNLGSAQEQLAQRDALVMQYMQMNMTAEQANRMAIIQQQQYGASQLNAGVAAQHGVALQQNGQNIQLAGGIAGAVGSVIGGVAGGLTTGGAGMAAGAAAGGYIGNAVGRGIASETSK